MESKAKVFGHPIHQTLVGIPLGLLGGAAIFDVVALFTRDPTMGAVAYWMVAGGIIGGLAAAPFGLMDPMAIPPRTRVARFGFKHGIGNMVVLALVIASWVLRPGPPEPAGVLALVLSYWGVALVHFTGWLGGEPVSRLDVGVSEGAHLDATWLEETREMKPRS